MKTLRTLSVVCAVFLLSGCEGWRDSLWDRNAPDEFFHQPLAPLVIPPRIDESAPASQEEQASALLGVSSRTGLSKAEEALLQRAGINALLPDVREIIDEESLSRGDVSRGLRQRLKEEILSPLEEAERLALEEQPVIYFENVVNIRP